MPKDAEDGSTAEDGTVLSPEELDISDEENVVEIEEGRYVISPGGGEPKVPSGSNGVPEQSVTEDEGSGESDAELTEAEVHEWIEARLVGADSKYAFDVTASFEGHTSQKALFSNDVVTTFENLVVWYATHAGNDTPVEDVLGILLVESNLSIRFPAESLRRHADSLGLAADDTLDDLFAATREAGGVRFLGGSD